MTGHVPSPAMRYGLAATSSVKSRLPFFACARMNEPAIPWWRLHDVKETSGGGALWLLGAPPVTAVAGQTWQVYPAKRGNTAPDPRAAAACDVDNLVVAQICLAGGAVLHWEGSWIRDGPDADPGFDREIGGMWATIGLAPLRIFAERDSVVVDVTLRDMRSVDWNEAVHAELADFTMRIQEGKPPMVAAQEALRTQQIVDTIDRAAAIGREVRGPRDTMTASSWHAWGVRGSAQWPMHRRTPRDNVVHGCSQRRPCLSADC